MKAKWIGRPTCIYDKKIIRICYECFECKAGCMKILYACRPAPKRCLKKGNFIDWTNMKFKKLLKQIEAERKGGLNVTDSSQKMEEELEEDASEEVS